jgi:hypothetical protein
VTRLQIFERRISTEMNVYISLFDPKLPNVTVSSIEFDDSRNMRSGFEIISPFLRDCYYDKSLHYPFKNRGH